MTARIRPEVSTYRFEAFLGEGLSSRVFAAVREDSRGFSRQNVVLKILKTETDVSWLKREFSVLSRLRSPHCVAVLGWENLPEGPALVLERIDGVTLKELTAHERLFSEEAEEVISQAQRGLRALHEAGLHHGDLSPSNIMVDRTGRVRLIDFAIETDQSSGTLAGTPPYMSPERWSGMPPSSSDDLFGLGLIRLELLDAGIGDFASVDGWRQRAFAARGWAGCPLLDAKPECRRFRRCRRTSQARQRLAGRVERLLALRADAARTTAILRPESLSREPVRAIAVRRHSLTRLIAIAALCLGLWVLAPTPVGSLEAHRGNKSFSPARLQLRSAVWMRVILNGQDKGFAPLDVDGLPPGSYSIRWRTAADAGEVIVKLRSGESKLLDSRVLKVLSRKRFGVRR